MTNDFRVGDVYVNCYVPLKTATILYVGKERVFYEIQDNGNLIEASLPFDRFLLSFKKKPVEPLIRYVNVYEVSPGVFNTGSLYRNEDNCRHLARISDTNPCGEIGQYVDTVRLEIPIRKK